MVDLALNHPPLSYGGHLFFLILGIVLLFIVVFAGRYELKYLSFSNPPPFVKGLSILSFIFMLALSLVCIFHSSIDFIILVTLVGILVLLLLIITPIQFVIRMRSFRELTMKRIEEKAKLIREVTDILDESKRKRFIESDSTLSGEGPSHNDTKAEG